MLERAQGNVDPSGMRNPAFASAVSVDLTNLDSVMVARITGFFGRQARVRQVQRKNREAGPKVSDAERVGQPAYRHRRQQFRRASKAAAPYLALMTLAGCVPYTLPPGPRMDSRSNVPAAVPSWIVAGQTTRHEVLVAFGVPDWVGPDNRSVAYWSAYGHGGVGVADMGSNSLGYAGRETREFRRLLITFDKADVVSDEKLVTMSCPWWRGSGIDGPYKMSFMRPVHVPCGLGEFPFGDLESAAGK